MGAIIVAGGGAAYLSSGLGEWEFAFCTLVSVVAYKGLTRNYMIGIEEPARNRSTIGI
ncbi:hypothetical protein FLV_12170 [Flavobacterium pectinovorum]|nr:hypothetical protein [Flavobacterium pectinovorum]